MRFSMAIRSRAGLFRGAAAAASLWRCLAVLIALAGLAAAGARPVEARVRIAVDLKSQTMHVDAAEGSFDWPISSARRGYRTPNGSFHVQRLEPMHRSHKYHNAPMPHSLFFSGGYAIHGTYETRALGRPASHGCIRLAPSHAAQLFAMVRAEGASITIAGGHPGAPRLVASRHGHADAAVHPRRAPQPPAMILRGGFTEEPLAYQPLRDRSYRHWMRDPFRW